MVRALALVVGCSCLIGCAHDTSADRLDENPALDPREVAAMLKLDCSQRREEVALARDEAQADFDRVANYKLALKAYTSAAERIEAAFTKEPDLLYAAEGDQLRLRLQRCQAQAKSFTDELRKFETAMQFKPKPSADDVEAPAQAQAVKAAPSAPTASADEAFDEKPAPKAPKLTKKQLLKKKALLAKKMKKKLRSGALAAASP